MKLSSRSRYGVRMMTVLALEAGHGPILLKDIAHSEVISEKYLSQIVIPLRSAGLLRSVRGARGGYELARASSAISLREIVEVLEGGLNLVDFGDGSRPPASPTARVVGEVWRDVSSHIGHVLDSLSLAEIARRVREQGHSAAMYNI